MKLETLRKRREFLRVRGGGRWATRAFVLEAKQRVAQQDNCAAESSPPLKIGPRFGFTVTKRLGNAVRRNRIRRRLKAAVQVVAEAKAKDHFDYVVIARAPAHDMTFADLTELIDGAFERVHRPPRKHGGRRRKRPDDGGGGSNSGAQTTDEVKINSRP